MPLALPQHLEDRVIAREGAAGEDQDLILYVMAFAVRPYENPALDVARSVATSLGKPLAIVFELLESEPFASDRHHRFRLEGARDVQRALRGRDLELLVHVERPGAPGSLAERLAERAAIVVTEHMPTAWARARVAAFAGIAPTWTVDTACVVPMSLTDRAYERAFRFRDATGDEREARAAAEWPTSETRPDAWGATDSASLDLAEADLAELIAECRIDHGVAPATDTVGGMSAGHERWDAFREERLGRYAKDRNDAALPAVSRMSAYLHHGHVSPFRLARDAAQVDERGSAKYLDELLVWRELAYHFCHHVPYHDSLQALPGWAQETLQTHADDARQVMSWERLSRGSTGNELWDLAQRSLVQHGELHNNLRMTWGKALLGWTESPEAALRTLVDLNHRFALDGSDPASYGGLLWCLGGFDRPFKPARKVFGTVRGRSIERHAERLNIPAYASIVRRPRTRGPGKVAVVGAGIAGLSCARTLHDHGVAVTLFDKGRGVGGRTAVRRVEPWEWDHGAQYFTARSAEFRRAVESAIHEGHVARYRGRIAAIGEGDVRTVPAGERFVGTPGMNALAKYLADDLDVRSSARVAQMHRRGSAWSLIDDEGKVLGGFDAVAVTAPPAQAADLVSGTTIWSAVVNAEMEPCWAVMIGFDTPASTGFDAAFDNTSGPLAWLAQNGSKPGRAARESWVGHATSPWSKKHLESDRDWVAEQLAGALCARIGRATEEVSYANAHRWRFARVATPAPSACLWDPEAGVGAAGDWCVENGRVEGAFLSGRALAGRILE